MTIRYIDFNRGSDTSDGSTPALAWKNLVMMSNFQPSAGGVIYLASDSTWDVQQTLTISGSQSQTRFNGTENSRAFITSYVPSGGDGSLMPTVSRKLIPTASDWLWDSTLDYGVARGWYLQFAYGASQWDILVEVNGKIVETTNQDTTNNTGLGHINGTQTGAHIGQYVNGMSYDTLRFNFDYAGGTVAGATGARLYLSGLGLHSSSVGLDPSSVYGPNAIKVAFGPIWSFWDSLNYTTISGLRITGGSGLMLYQGTADTVRKGFELTGCKSYDTTCPIRINSGTGSVSATQWDMDIHHNEFERLTGPAFIAYGIGVTGYFRNNSMTNGNLASSMGGGVYMQLKPSMVGSTRTPFKVESNLADTWKNGAGNNTWDGGCYYADIQDEGTIFRGNTAKNSFVAFQCGSGSRSEWYSNKSINCEYAGLFNNALSMDRQDYVFAHNLHIAAMRGTFTHGESATVHPYSFAVYSSGSASNFVGGKFINNVFINHPAQPNEIPLLAWADSQWQSGKVGVSNNVFIGYNNSRLVVSDFNTVDKTIASNSVVTTSELTALSGNYVPSCGSILSGLGKNIDDIAILNDFSGVRFCEPPSAGPHEVARKRDWLANY